MKRRITIKVKILSAVITAVMVLIMTACGETAKEVQKEVSVEVSEESFEESSGIIPKNRDDREFLMIAKLDELPDYMSDNPDIYSDLLGNIMKLYYTGIINGRINKDNFKPERSNDVLPSADSTADERKKSADYCTIGGALEYYSVDDRDIDYYLLYNGCLPYFCHDREGNINLIDNISADNIWQLTDYDEILRYVFKYSNTDRLEADAIAFIAGELNNACVSYYNGIKTQKIKSGDFVQQYTHDTLPNEYTTPEPALGLAKHATIGGAMEYIGKYQQFSVCIKKLGTNDSHKIYAMSNSDISDLKVLSSTNMTMAELFGIS